METKDELRNRIDRAMDFAHDYAQIDGSHHKAWCIDQMVRALTGCGYHDGDKSDEYKKFIKDHNEGEDGPDTYEWDEGIAP